MQQMKKRVPVATLGDFAASLLIGGGLRCRDAEKTAELLVRADARGVYSHGVMRIPFGYRADFLQATVELSTAIKALPKAAGTNEILLPGERDYGAAADAARSGIALEPSTAAALAKLGHSLAVPVPDAVL